MKPYVKEIKDVATAINIIIFMRNRTTEAPVERQRRILAGLGLKLPDIEMLLD